MEQEYNLPRSSSLLETEAVWVGKNQGKPLINRYTEYKIDQAYVGLEKIDGEEEHYRLDEGLFHLPHLVPLSKSNPSDTICRDTTITSWDEMVNVQGLNSDRIYTDLDNYLSRTQTLRTSIRPMFRDLLSNLQQLWVQIIDRLDRREKFDPTTERVNSSFYYGL